MGFACPAQRETKKSLCSSFGLEASMGFACPAQRETKKSLCSSFGLEASMGFEPMIRVLQTLALATWPRRHDSTNRGLLTENFNLQSAILNHLSGRWDSNPRPSPWQGDVLPLNHARRASRSGRECREPGSNWRHRNFQSRALPTELSRPVNVPRSKQARILHVENRIVKQASKNILHPFYTAAIPGLLRYFRMRAFK